MARLVKRRRFIVQVLTAGSALVWGGAAHLSSASSPSTIRISGEGVIIEAYRALPVGRPWAAVLLVPEEAGLNAFIAGVAAELATLGFAVLVPDLYSRLGGTAALGPNPAAALEKLNDSLIARDLDLSFAYLEKLLGPQGKIAILGFGWGGSKALTYATENPDIAAVAVFYAPNPEPVGRVLNLEMPLLGNYAALDEAVTPKLAELEAALTKAGKTYDFKIYPGVRAGFFGAALAGPPGAAASRDAWERTVQFFRRTLAAQEQP
ncbi:dienelactone hydrolase family protein [Gloeobacter violaceus]|uniref:dienelactone hydrolase family protein n=1 Tax=Gloeobacter violaceus TaxID=33072 RepID=UPI0013E8D378|nr:dienelactone hydrolase family protein [Gloeobacter violaceus]